MNKKERRRAPSETTRLRISLLLFPAVLLCVAASAGAGNQEPSKEKRFLEGRLVSTPEHGPRLETGGKEVPLAAVSTYLLHTLEDKRLENRLVRVEGKTRPDHSFEVAQLYTIKEGKTYRVRYYCETCNIEALEPGRCVCCQQPTELQEIPVTAAP